MTNAVRIPWRKRSCLITTILLARADIGSTCRGAPPISGHGRLPSPQIDAPLWVGARELLLADYLFLNPRHTKTYHPENLEEALRNIKNDAVRDATTEHLLYLDGMDQVKVSLASKAGKKDLTLAESMPHSGVFTGRMQTEAAEVFDVSREPQHVLDMYGPGVQARQILIARRLVERGVRFVQLWPDV